MPETVPPETAPPEAAPPLDPFVVTLRLDAALFAALDGLRRAHVPPERNLIPAHVSLFHALPGAGSPGVRRALAAVAGETAPFALALPGLHPLGRGVAVRVDGGAHLGDLHRRLVAAISAEIGLDALTAQDRQPFRAHVTVQNKVTPERARETLAALSATWTTLSGSADGLDLWRYRGGPWQHVKTYAFEGA